MNEPFISYFWLSLYAFCLFLTFVWLLGKLSEDERNRTERLSSLFLKEKEQLSDEMEEKIFDILRTRYVNPSRLWYNVLRYAVITPILFIVFMFISHFLFGHIGD